VIIPTHNRAPRLRQTLDALIAQKTPADLTWEILVVDNRSTDGTRALVWAMTVRAPDRIRYVFEPRLGKSWALNTGITAARGTVIALTDDDVSPAPDWVATAVEVLDRRDVDGAGGRILPWWEAPPPDWLLENRRLRDYLALMEHDAPAMLAVSGGRYPQIWGANMVFRRAALQALGGFDTMLGPVGQRRYVEEDCDLVRRMLQSGRRIAYDPALTVFHRIPQARMRRAYFLRAVWDMGEGQALAAGPASGRRLFGAPLWRYRYTAWLFVRSALRIIARRPGIFDSALDCAAEGGTFWGHCKRVAQQRRGRGGTERSSRTAGAPPTRAPR
jgi:glycosyltransferase involved in cell wall biosynthesis